MPRPKKLDLIPATLKEQLARVLTERGFGDIIDVTEELNFWLEEAGLEVSIGKTAVGEYAKLLKDQREAFSMAETLLSDMDIEAESDIQRALMQMIAASAMQFMRAAREEDAHIDPKGLMSLSKMLKDLMSSSGMREKMLADERKRLREEMQAEQEAKLKQAVADGETSESVGAEARRILFGE